MPVLEVTEHGLQELDFDPMIPCTLDGCDAVAVKVARCRQWPTAAHLLCQHHLDELLAWAANIGRMNQMFFCVTCRACGPRLDDVAELIDL